MNLLLVFPIIIIVVYAVVGTKINQNALKWAVIGLLVMTSVLLVFLPVIILINDPKVGMIIWQCAYFLSWIIAVVIISLVYRRHNVRPFTHKAPH